MSTFQHDGSAERGATYRNEGESMQAHEAREREIELVGERLHIETQPGLPDWEDLAPAIRLLATHARLNEGESVLIWPSVYGALAAIARRRGAHPEIYDTNCRAAQAAQQGLERNGHGKLAVQIALPAAEPRHDAALLLLPKGRDLARLYLLHAALSLVPGGILYLAGPNRGGIKSVIKDGDILLGSGSVLGYKGGNRVAAWRRPAKLPNPLPEIYNRPGILPNSYASLEITIGKESFTVCTRPGVFSRDALDAGTRLLLESLTLSEDEGVLDIGCGYGIIGLYASRKAPRGQVTMTDINLLAYQCAKASARANGLEQKVRILLGPDFEPIAKERFSLIISNPTFHSKHAVDRAMAQRLIQQAHAHLVRRGRLMIVANRFLPYDKEMERCFKKVTVLSENERYHVLCSRR